MQASIKVGKCHCHYPGAPDLSNGVCMVCGTRVFEYVEIRHNEEGWWIGPFQEYKNAEYIAFGDER